MRARSRRASPPSPGRVPERGACLWFPLAGQRSGPQGDSHRANRSAARPFAPGGERGAIPLRAAREMEELRPIVHRALSRRVYRHYHGFATGQLHEFEAAEGAPVKKILYVLRTTLTGTHLLRTSEVQTDVTKLLDSYGFADAHELVAAKLAGERVYLAASLKGRWMEA